MAKADALDPLGETRQVGTGSEPDWDWVIEIKPLRLKPYISGGGKAGLTRRNPVDDTFSNHDNSCMGTT